MDEGRGHGRYFTLNRPADKAGCKSRKKSLNHGEHGENNEEHCVSSAVVTSVMHILVIFASPRVPRG
jgi:hypothetical protein